MEQHASSQIKTLPIQLKKIYERDFLYDTAKIYLKLQQLKRYGSGIGVNTCTKKIKDSRNGHFNI